MSLLSLVLATYGRCDDVGRMLDSLLAQTDQNFEVLIVDQNPDDRLLAHVRNGIAQGLNIRHLRLDKPTLSGARNLGIAEATGEIIAFPDDDCWYEAEAVAEVRQAFAGAEGLDGIVGCWVEQRRANGEAAVPERLSGADWRRFRGGCASSITLFLKRSLLLSLGGFDRRFGVGQWYGSGEEFDLVLRSLNSGARIEYRLAVRVHHAFGEQTPSGGLLARCAAMRRRGRGVGALYAKHSMSAWVIVRGLSGQFMRPLLRAQGAAAVVGVCSAFGIMEGFCRWRLFESRKVSSPLQHGVSSS